jgi:hypothetical protein
VQRQAGRCIGHHSEVAPQVVHCLVPQVGPLTLELVHLLQCLFQVPHVSNRLDLL